MTKAIEVTGLSKTFPSGVCALDNVALDVAAGQVYGLVGRNGAGKTTLMRVLVGLVAPTAGTARVLGRPAGSEGSGAAVGSLIESPAFYPRLSGHANLVVLSRYLGLGRPEVDRVLAEVGLTARAGERFGGYSLGMKQRLGLAAALLGDPELLILDEPANGLDPQAMVDIRELLSRWRDRGRTVLLSSHLLTELELVADRVAILHEGRVAAEGTPDQLRRGAAARGTSRRIEVSDVPRAVDLLRDLSEVREVVPGPGAVEVSLSVDSPSGAVRALVDGGVEVSAVSQLDSLESVYLSLTGDRTPAVGAPGGNR